MFGCILGLWAMQPLVPGHASSGRLGLPLVSWVSSWPSHWQASLTISVLPLPQHILYAGQNVSRRFCDWVDISVPQLEAFFIYRRWPVQAMHHALLGVFAKITLIDSQELSLHHPQMQPPISIVSPIPLSITLPLPVPSCFFP